ncbi:hypothetical protein SKAU_G00088410 [Synaphobranchus kaupii]|uniref:Protein NPAT C-terminal domain-containing protein n=1 Tax=Synaphobranchus kaupii TaxID=118154 RepID=A0A9Q1FW15_SYNKA|nr:hypothetical protein SKAU_G00088410 [Synaphobranchus kaupii]
MLLPSDVARLVLGYLEQEGLCTTTQAFLLESPHLKEYASHRRNHGAISTCAFSLFGKNLTTILTEYVAATFTDTSQEIEVPAMMTSLWKKLDITLNQIKCLQSFLTHIQDPSCSKKAAESRTSKMRNMMEPKSSKRRKMTRPLPRASRLVETLLPSYPIHISRLDTQSAVARIPLSDKRQLRPSQCIRDAHSDPVGSGAPCSLSLEAGTHPDADEPRDSTEIPNLAQPLYQSDAQEGFQTSEGHKGRSACSTSGSETDPNGPSAVGDALGASGKSEASRVDGGQSMPRLQVAIFPSGNSLETGTRSHSACSSMQEATGTTLIASTFQLSLIQPTLQSIRVPHFAAELKDMKKFTVVPNQMLKSQTPSVRRLVKPNPRTEPSQKQTTDTGTAMEFFPDLATEWRPVVTPLSGPSSASRPQSHRRMLCFEVSGKKTRSAETAKLNLIGQCTSGPTFWWMKPHVLDGTRAVGSKSPAETVKARDVGEEESTTHIDESLIRDRKGTPCRSLVAWRPRLQSMVGGKDAARLDSSGKKSQIAHGEEETESRRGTNQVRPKDTDERDMDRRSGKVLTSRGQAETTSSLEEPPHRVTNKENKLKGRDWGKPRSGTATPSVAPVHSPELPSLVCPQQTSAKTSILIRQVAEILKDNQEQSPTPSPSKPLPLPRTPAQGCDPDREAMSQHPLQDSAFPDGPISASSPATNIAAHTLMILSRAIMARTSTPPKDNGQQGVTHACQGRKHLLHKLPASPASMEELKLSAKRTKVKRRKRLLDCFPDDLDVDKFLSSLDYDD